MKPPSGVQAGSRASDLGLLRGASLLVPGEQRAEWWREWHAELWQVRRDCACGDEFSWAAEREIAGFCLGAFQDAFYLRRMDRQPQKRTPLAVEVRRGLAMPSASWLHCWARVLRWRGCCRACAPSAACCAVRVRPGLVLIEDVNNEDSPRTISSGQYRAWKDRKQEFFDGFAFYRVTQGERELAAGGGSFAWKRGLGSGAGQLEFLCAAGPAGAVQETDASVDADLPSVILSESLWKREFGADPHVAGSVVRVGSRRATIAGVAPRGSLGAAGQGGCVAAGAGLADGSGRRRICGGAPVGFGEVEDGSRADSDHIVCAASLAGRSAGDRAGQGNAGPVGCVSVRGVAGVSGAAGDYIGFARRPERERAQDLVAEEIVPLGISWRQDRAAAADCLFCVARSGLWLHGFNANQALYLQLVSTFFICLFGMQLGAERSAAALPGLPAARGASGAGGATFQNVSGMERDGADVHGRAHAAACSVAADELVQLQRWMFLDPSWEFLFAGPGRG